MKQSSLICNVRNDATLIINQFVYHQQADFSFSFCFQLKKQAMQTNRIQIIAIHLLRVSFIDNKTYQVEAGSHLFLFETNDQQNQYGNLSKHYFTNLQSYLITQEQYYNGAGYDKKKRFKSYYNSKNYYKNPMNIARSLDSNFRLLKDTKILFCAEQFKQFYAYIRNTDFEICSLQCYLVKLSKMILKIMFCVQGEGQDKRCNYATINYILMFLNYCYYIGNLFKQDRITLFAYWLSSFKPFLQNQSILGIKLFVLEIRKFGFSKYCK
ncbi:unnamed protein product [Paramecium octaurelia]|uniref:Uncharacterized protein n=1 Tax=Paramecium octaurelia TaxID=43137 RepID=A0A8S1VK11_PAROT|nr:unnamed protein product [Paramecium octaurelia]